MQPTNTELLDGVNFEYGLLFAFFFTLPMALIFARHLVLAFKAQKIVYVPVEVEVEKPQKTKIEYRYITKYKTPSKSSAKPKNKTKPRKQKRHIENSKKRTPAKTLNVRMISDAADGLKNIGIPKRQGVELAKKLYMSKTYNSTEKLFEDCLSELKKS